MYKTECDAARESERNSFTSYPGSRARGIEFGPRTWKNSPPEKSDKTHKQSDERLFFLPFVQGPERGNVVSIARI